MATRFHLFLDVDGVLHPVKWVIPGLDAEVAKQKHLRDLELIALFSGYRGVPDSPCFSKLPLFERTIEPHLGRIEIVVTSSWRTDPKSYQMLLDALSPNIRTRVVEGMEPKGRRPDLINRWLREHAEPDALAIVIDDDLSWEWRRVRDSVVLLFPDEKQGFSEIDAAWLAYFLALSGSEVEKLKPRLGGLNGHIYPWNLADPPEELAAK